jgi:hypothetical protein
LSGPGPRVEGAGGEEPGPGAFSVTGCHYKPARARLQAADSLAAGCFPPFPPGFWKIAGGARGQGLPKAVAPVPGPGRPCGQIYFRGQFSKVLYITQGRFRFFHCHSERSEEFRPFAALRVTNLIILMLRVLKEGKIFLPASGSRLGLINWASFLFGKRY